MNMVLASASPRRVDILRQAGFSPTVLPQDVDETPLPGEHPVKLVRRLALAKAHACAEELAAHGEDGRGDGERGLVDEAIDNPDDMRDQVIVAADTIVWDEDGDVLGKPADADEARSMLRTLSDRRHHVSTGVCVSRGGVFRSFVETTDVWFFSLTNAEIDAYVATGDPLDKAGAYGYQSLGCTLVERIEGDYYNVVGLPIGRLVRKLQDMQDER